MNSQNTEMSAKKMSREDEYEVVIEQLDALLKEDDHLLPKKTMDQQIMAFSQRELKLENESMANEKSRELSFSGTLNTTHWWRNLGLPSFVVAGFAMTAFAFHILWQPLMTNDNLNLDKGLNAELSMQQSVEQKEMKKEMTLTLNNDERSTQLVAAKKSKTRLLRESENQELLNELNENNKIPRQDIRYSDVDLDANLDKRSSPKIVAKGFIRGQEKSDESLESNNIYTGSELTKSNYPEKEAWAKNIIQMIKNGEKERAQSELSLFKRAYPNFDIDKKIESIKN